MAEGSVGKGRTRSAAGPTDGPTAGPTGGPTDGPTGGPTAGPTDGPTAGPIGEMSQWCDDDDDDSRVGGRTMAEGMMMRCIWVMCSR